MRYMKFQDNVNFEFYKLLCTIARSLNSVITTFTIKTYPRYIYIYVSFTFKSRLLRLKCHVHISSRGRSSEHHFFFLFLEIDFSSI